LPEQNATCFVGPHRRYDPFTKAFYSLEPGQGHFVRRRPVARRPSPVARRPSPRRAHRLRRASACAGPRRHPRSKCTHSNHFLVPSHNLNYASNAPNNVRAQDARWRRGESVSLKAARDSMVGLELASQAQMVYQKRS
jgi:hypothetical protein